MTDRQLSERARFFLKHRSQIEEWASLRPTFHSEVHDFFSSLRDLFETQAQELAGEPQLFAFLERSEPSKLFFTRINWSGKGEGDHPLVAIGLEWGKREPEFDKSYIGVWVNRHKASSLATFLVENLGADLSILVEKADEFRAGSNWSSTRSDWWPLLRNELPEKEPVWENLDSFAAQIVHDVGTLWTLTWQDVDAAFESWKE